MRTFLAAWLAGVASCGGGPALRNVPQPNTAVVAGAAAAIAGAATLASPAAAAKNAAEANKPTTEKRPMKSGPTVPADVFDRLDQQGRAGPPGQPVPPAQDTVSNQLPAPGDASQP